MNSDQLQHRLNEIMNETLPLPGHGNTPERHRRLMHIGREDLSLAKLAEAHWDAVAILAEAGRSPHPDALYAVWASEIPGKALILQPAETGYCVVGLKPFCSGAGVVDRALVSVGLPDPLLVEVDLRSTPSAIEVDSSAWQTDAFRITNTGAILFKELRVSDSAILGGPNWYTERVGFWHGACGPAACWAGGAAGLLDFAMHSSRHDPHTLAHLAAMHANVWAMECYLDAAGRQIDEQPHDRDQAQLRALQVRHLVEQACSDTLRRFARAYGPSPLSMDTGIPRRCHELDLYLRQSHGERDLESLGRNLARL